MDDVIGKLLEENNMPDTPTARAIYRKMLEHHAEDDDIQDYKRPWVGLTDDEIRALAKPSDDTAIPMTGRMWIFVGDLMTKLKEKNT